MIASRTSTGYRWSRNRYRSRTRQSGSAARAEAALKRAVELGDGYIGAGSTPMDTFLEDIKRLPLEFPKAKRLYLSLGDNLQRLREWFGAFYRKPQLCRAGRSMGITTANCGPDRASQECRR